MDERSYKNQFTLDGRLRVAPSVTPAKVKAIKGLVEATMNGDRIAKGRLEEVLSSSDAIFAYAHLTNINFLPQYEKADRKWKAIAGTRSVSDFTKPVLYSMFTNGFTGTKRQGSDPDGIAPSIAEGQDYPYAYLSGEEAQSGGIGKRGFKTDWTFEARRADTVGFIAALPGEMLATALDTEEYEVFSALINGVTASQKLVGGTVPEGGTVAVNAPLSRLSLIRAKYELSQRKVNNRFVVVNGGYNLIVPIGQGEFIKFWMNQAIAEIVNGSATLTVSGYNPLADIEVIESEYVTGTNWYLMPKPGATRRPVLDRGTLIGEEAPELRIENVAGNYMGGSAVSPFEGSFQNDSITLRLRMFGGGILWSPNHIVWSNGTSA